GGEPEGLTQRDRLGSPGDSLRDNTLEHAAGGDHRHGCDCTAHQIELVQHPGKSTTDPGSSIRPRLFDFIENRGDVILRAQYPGYVLCHRAAPLWGSVHLRLRPA